MGSRRSRHVSWAAGANLCKVRLFISDDSPSQAGFRPQDNLQAKGSWLMHAAGTSSDDSLPPGFESSQPTNGLKIDISQIPVIMWKCPSRMLLDPDWHIVAGGESEEISIQNERTFGALEAIYPRTSNIPPNPFVSPDVKDSFYDDSGTQSVPLIPVEDDDASDQLEAPLFDLPQNYNQSDKHNPAEISLSLVSHTPIAAAQQQTCGSTGVLSYDHSSEADVLAAASAAYTAIMQCNQKGSMIDQDLLVKILSDPSQVDRLMIEYSQSRRKQCTSSFVFTPMQPGPAPQMTATAPVTFTDHLATSNLPAPPPMMNPPVNRAPQAVPSVAMNPPPDSSLGMNFAGAPVRDITYYKTLIHQRGSERQEPLGQHGMQFGMYHHQHGGVDPIKSPSIVSRDTKVRPKRPCAYFKGPKGCRNGANCTFLHDSPAPSRQEQTKGSKRIKLDSRIAGRN